MNTMWSGPRNFMCHWFKSVLLFDYIAGLFWTWLFEVPQMLHGDGAQDAENLLWSCLLIAKKIQLNNILFSKYWESGHTAVPCGGFSPKCICLMFFWQREYSVCESIWKSKSAPLHGYVSSIAPFRLSIRMMGFPLAIKQQLWSNFNDPVTTWQSLICIASLLLQRFSMDLMG